jgi:predicted nucleic acid-binding protein
MYLIDTNVISEARKGKKANPGVIDFWEHVDAADVYLPAQTIGELRRGLENVRQRGDVRQTELLERWLELVTSQYVDRILSFDADCAQVWGRLMSPHPQHPIDKQIAAVALIYDLTIVTRNVDDFRDTGAKVLNPFR